MLIGSEMSSLKSGSFALGFTLNFHICTHLTLKMKPGWGLSHTTSTSVQMTCLKFNEAHANTENNDYNRACSILYFTTAPHAKRRTFCHPGSDTDGQKLGSKHYFKALHLTVCTILRKQVLFILQAGNRRHHDWRQYLLCITIRSEC